MAVVWEFEKYASMWKALEDEHQQLLNRALADEHDGAEYVWVSPWAACSATGTPTHIRYEFDLARMTQTNMFTGYKRRIRCISIRAGGSA
jgi:hypothetical protein